MHIALQDRKIIMQQEKWIMHSKKADFKQLSEKYGIDQVTARVLINRGVEEADIKEFLEPSLENLYSPHELMDLDKGVEMTSFAIENHHKIRVIGDYDCDGINSTFILTSGLKEINADVSYDIPDRLQDGYGLNARLVEKALDDGVDLIITCDNGIAAYDAIKEAKDSGINVIVTDHHEVPFEKDGEGNKSEILPPADCVINPHRNGDDYPFKSICGAVVAWKFITAIFEKYGKAGEEIKYLENAAFATVCDVMPLKSENRTIVSLGLNAMEHTKNKGLKALIRETGIEGKELTAYHFGFVLGPCFNATGRLATAKAAIRLLFSTDEKEASDMAAEIHNMNEERKSMTEQGRQKAAEMLTSVDLQKNPVIILNVPDLHESLCGLVAGKIKEEYYHPTFILTKTENGLKGSGRSIEAYSMFEKMSECKELFTQFGGHPMAAGLTIPEDNFEEFKRRMNEKAGLIEKDFEKKVMIDVPMPLKYLYTHSGIVDEIERLSPFGEGNPKPLFAEKKVPVKKIASIGKVKKYWKISFIIDTYHSIDALYFGDADEFKEYYINKYSEKDWEFAEFGRPQGLVMTIAYVPQWNEYKGQRTLQIIIEHFQ